MTFGILSNELITLQPLTREDHDRLFLVASDPEIWKQHPDANRYQPEGFREYFDKLIQTDEPYLILKNEDNTLIGATSFYEKDNLNKSIAIGYTFLSTECWGGKYNASLKNLMIDSAFSAYNKIIFHVREQNKRSQAALLKIGAIKEKEYPSLYDPSSLQLEYVIYK